MTLDPGDRLQGTKDTFLVEGLCGEGGFGVTYRCRREGDGLPVIAKVLRVERLDEWKSLELFEREAKVLAQLHHESIPDYVDYFPQGDAAAPEGLVLVQELVEGQDLAAGLRAGRRLDEGQMLDWLAQILDVLAYLHGLSPPVIHRDISPKNIILREDGRAFLVDFGTVQAAVLSESTIASTAAGTFGFAPPEQFMGRATPASDLYGLAMTYLAVATGRQPEELAIDGLRVDVREAIRHDARIMLLLEAMTEPDPGERLGEAREALRRLEPLLAARPGRPAAPAAPAAEPAPEPAEPTKRPAAAPAKRPEEPAKRPPVVMKAAPPLEQREDPGRIDRALCLAAKERLDAMNEPWPRPDPPRAAKLKGAGLSLDGRRLVLDTGDERWSVSIGEESAQPLRPKEQPDDLWAACTGDPKIRLARSPDGELLAKGKGNTIRLKGQSAGNGTMIQADFSAGLLFSPDGRELIAVGQRKVAFFGRDGSERRVGGSAFDYRPDGRLSALAQGGKVQLEPDGPTLNLSGKVTGLRFSPDGRRLAILLAEGKANQVIVYDLDEGGARLAMQEVQVPPSDDLQLLGFSGDGRRVLAFGRLLLAKGQHARPECVLLFDAGGPFLGTFHLTKDPPRPVFVTPREFWHPLAGEGSGSPWCALGVARRALFEGLTEAQILDEPTRLALEDHDLRWLLLGRVLDKSGKQHRDELMKATAGLTHLLPQLVLDAKRLADNEPRFGKARRSAAEAEDLIEACKALRARPAAEQQVIFEEMLARMEREEAEQAAKEASRAREEAERAERVEAERARLKAAYEERQREKEAAEQREKEAAEAKLSQEERARLRREEERKRSWEEKHPRRQEEKQPQRDEGRQQRNEGRAPAPKPPAPSGPLPRWHRGYLLPAILGPITVGLGIAGVVMVASGIEVQEIIGSFSLAGVFLLTVGLLIFAFHARCPKCRALYARKVLSKTFSHTATSQESYRDSQGNQQTRTVHRRIYSGSFRCRRCGHHWTGYM